MNHQIVNEYLYITAYSTTLDSPLQGNFGTCFEISLNINDLFVLLSQFCYIFNFTARLISSSGNDQLISF